MKTAAGKRERTPTTGPQKCCVCLETLEESQPARTCGACTTTICAVCLHPYIKKVALTVLKCPQYGCVAEIAHTELQGLFAKSFITTELARIRHERLLENDRKYALITREAVLPVYVRLAKTTSASSP